MDLATGEGLEPALRGCDVVVDASNNAGRKAAAVLVDGTRRLLAVEQAAGVIGRSPAAVRQLASRARQHVDDGRPRFPPTPAEQEELVTAFAAAPCPHLTLNASVDGAGRPGLRCTGGRS